MQTVTLNNIQYSIPDVGDDAWGQNVTNYLVKVASDVFQKSGGTFTLTADADFGSSFGLRVEYLRSRNTAATSGVIRLANNEGLGWRNVANSANVFLTIDANDKWDFDGSKLSTAELSYLAGVTSAIQTQLNAKQADVVTTRGDVVIGDSGGNATRLGIGTNGQVLRSNGTDVGWETVAGTGDVTAALAFSNDNRLIRSDGTGKGIQASGIIINDSDQLARGTSTLTRIFEIQDSAASTGTVFFYNTNASYTGIILGVTALASGSGATVLRLAGNDGSTEILNAMANGQVVIGSSTPTSGSALDVNGVLMTADGSVSAPGIAFRGDTNTGIYRIGSDIIGFSVAGAEVARMAVNAIMMPSGSVTAPAFAFKDDTNTGIYRIGADALGITTNGTKRLEVSSGGNIGINLTPSTWGLSYRALQLGGGSLWATSTAAAGASVAISQNNTFNGSNSLYTVTDEASRYLQENGTHRFQVAASGTAGGTITWIDGAYIDAAGKVGFGTNSPSNAFEVFRDSGTVKGFIESTTLASGEESGVGALGGNGNRAAQIGVGQHSGSSPTGFIRLSSEDGTSYNLWVDNTGDLRISNTAGDIGGSSGGSVVGGQS